ncbi:ectonucleoside triphosphate diphosphohydrolase 6 [Scomber japonicus]|uniref:ectonucleoside triphosphate diphosphohydrolase 6 n=1 Tax=Scomber japonicus TaxID=13676 RepID=UPI0023051E37|nr:ectonucleoside triphosphate diphosphohydrolase 6 [Scomber japonicus]XP_053189618.1 ectonucleoside triphosphate diphosphohydrolase 6 [Scomber japonicus]
MKRPKFAGVFLSAGFLLAYLMFVKRHYASTNPHGNRLPPHLQQPPHPDPDPPTGTTGFQYGIMFDAGSTGTRIHIFKFHTDSRGAPELSKETFRAIKPGLSAYADDPQKCSSGISELLEEAQRSVPPSLWSRTPVVLKATAGLRLLPGEKAQLLLDTVKQLFIESPFLSAEDSVSIMDGTDEGISAWITVNFLTGGLHRSDSPTVGMLDLGGGSTQITFSPQDEKTIQTSPIEFIRSFQMFNNTHTVYTHSYLGLGLMSARLSVLGGVEALPLGGSTQLVSPCLAPEYSGSWEHDDIIYTVSGQKAGEPVYDACRVKVEKLLYRKVFKASEAADVEFYAFSYYYDRAVDLGLIEEQTGGSVRVSEYIDAAKRVCSSPSPLQSPFLCLDLVYISVLLQELGFPPTKSFKLARSIQQVETSWALGATFHYLETLNAS